MKRRPKFDPIAEGLLCDPKLLRVEVRRYGPSVPGAAKYDGTGRALEWPYYQAGEWFSGNSK